MANTSTSFDIAIGGLVCRKTIVIPAVASLMTTGYWAFGTGDETSNAVCFHTRDGNVLNAWTPKVLFDIKQIYDHLKDLQDQRKTSSVILAWARNGSNLANPMKMQRVTVDAGGNPYKGCVATGDSRVSGRFYPSDGVCMDLGFLVFWLKDPMYLDRQDDQIVRRLMLRTWDARGYIESTQMDMTGPQSHLD
jgi:plasmid stabilization system protein ParE